MIIFQVLDNITDEHETASDILWRLQNRRHLTIITKKATFVHPSIQQWVDRHTQYLQSLTWQDQATILAYTYRGHNIVNTFLRNEFDWNKCIRRGFITQYRKYIFPLVLPIYFRCWRHKSYVSVIRWFWCNRHRFTDKMIHGWMMSYISRLSRIIRKAPPAPEDMTVYRGLNGRRFLILDKESSIINPSFMSTTLSVKKAKTFIPQRRACCLQRIRVQRKHRCLFVPFLSYYPDELEVLFLPESRLVDLENSHTLRGGKHPVRLLEYAIRNL